MRVLDVISLDSSKFIYTDITEVSFMFSRFHSQSLLYPPQDEANRSSLWGKIKEAITAKCRKFRSDKKTYRDDFKH